MTVSQSTLANFSRLIEVLQAACVKCQPEIPGLAPAKAVSHAAESKSKIVTIVKEIPRPQNSGIVEASVCDDNAVSAAATVETQPVEAVGDQLNLNGESSSPASEAVSSEPGGLHYNGEEGVQLEFEAAAPNFIQQVAAVGCFNHKNEAAGKIAPDVQLDPAACPLCSGSIPMMRRAELAFTLSLLLMPMFTTVAQAQDSLICEQNVPYWRRWEEYAQRDIANFSPPELHLEVSPDGSQVAFADIRTVTIYDAETLTPEHILRTNALSPLSMNMSISWSPDSQRLAVAQLIPSTEEPDPLSGIYIWDVENEEGFNAIPTEPRFVAWSPDGRTIAGLVGGWTFEPTLQVWNAESLDTIYTYNFRAGANPPAFRTHVQSLMWSPDSTRLAGMARENDLLGIWDINRGELQTHTLPLGTSGDDFDWASDGRFVAFGNQAIGMIPLWDTQTQQVDDTRTLNNGFGFLNDLEWSPDGRWLAQASRYGLTLWDMTSESREPARILRENAPAFLRIAWLPDSQHLISVDFEGSIYRWDIETGCVEAAILNDRPP